MVHVNGETRLLGIIGYPLTYTVSPAMHNAVLEHLGMNFAYVPLVVESGSLYHALEGVKALGFVGVNVTMPHKEAVVPYMDEVASYAEMVGAVNTIHIKDGRLIGYNTDGRGFISSLENDAGFEAEGKKVVILGAGGGARSVAVSLCLAKAAAITIANRTVDRAESLAEMLSAKFGGCDVSAVSLEDDGLAKAMSAAELVVNAIPVGMDPEVEVPAAIESVSKKHLVFDLVYKPEESPVLAAAGAKGAKCQNGLGMLAYQGANSFEIWTGHTAPTDVMIGAARKALADDGSSGDAVGQNEDDELAGLLNSAGSE